MDKLGINDYYVSAWPEHRSHKGNPSNYSLRKTSQGGRVALPDLRTIAG